jgi:hypothetical protein
VSGQSRSREGRTAETVHHCATGKVHSRTMSRTHRKGEKKSKTSRQRNLRGRILKQKRRLRNPSRKRMQQRKRPKK